MSKDEVKEYIIAWKIYQEFYNKATILKKIAHERAQCEFDIICKNIGLQFYEIEHIFYNLPKYEIVPGSSCHVFKMPKVLAAIDEQGMQELFEVFAAVFAKLTAGRSEFAGKKITDEKMQDDFEIVLNNIIISPELLREQWPLFNLVDQKIAELEA